MANNKNMASVLIISECLCYTIKAMRRCDKTTVIQSLAKFYHDDELVAAKSELCKCLQAVVSAMPTAPGIDGLSKFVNGKGVPISRRGNDAAHRRVLEAEDVVGMLMIADLCNAVLPTFVAADMDRVPGLYWSTGDAVSANVEKLTTAVDDLLKRMKEMESKLTTPSTYVDNVNTGYLATCNKGAAGESSGESSGNLCSLTTGVSVHQSGKSFASLAADIAVSKPAFSFKKMVRGRHQAGSSSIKVVPREPTCFAGRLDKDVTEQQLHEFLTGQGMKGVTCKKLVAKDGKTFRTSAFRVTCCLESADLFYDELLWPSGVELRDWVFYPKNNNGSA